MKTSVLLSAFLLFSVLISYAQWTYTNLSEPKEFMGSAALGNKVYFAGGYTGTEYLSEVEVYDVSTGVWGVAGNLSVPRELPGGSVSCGSKIFFAGGFNWVTSFNTVDVYDTLTKQWSVLSLSDDRFSLAAISHGSKVMFAGGVDYPALVYKSVVDIYDTQTGVWTINYLSIPREGIAAAVAGDYAIFAGGLADNGATDRVDIYNFTTSTWSQASLSQARGMASATTIGSKVFIAGGNTALNSTTDRVDIFDVTDGTWTVASLSFPRAAHGNAATVCGKAYFAGGGRFMGSGYTAPSDVIDIYDAASNTWSVMNLQSPRVQHAVNGVGDYLVVAGGKNNTGKLSSVEIFHDPTLIHIPADFHTIQQGINAASDGDTVLVAENTYFENINFYGKAILLGSELIMDGDTSHISNTIINGSQPVNPDFGSVVTFTSGEDTTSVLCGFTITGGTGTFVPDAGNAIAGGGVFIQYSGGKLLNNYIEYNLAINQGFALGGGVCAGGPITNLPWVVLRGNRIYINQAFSNANYASGGGIMCYYNLIMEKNEISLNEAKGHLGGDGGGIAIMGSFGLITIEVNGNEVTYNKSISDMGTIDYAALGGGMGIYFDVTGRISNNDFSFNTIDAPGSFWSWGPGVFIQDIPSNGFVFENNLVKQNNAITTQNCHGGGLSLLRSGGLYQNNVIQNNSVSHAGGFNIAYSKDVSDTAILINNTITDNTATFGGGIYAIVSDVILINSIIWNNTASYGTSIYNGGSTLEVRYSDVEGTTTWPGEGNVNIDPQFLDDGYHLSPQSQLQNVAVSKINLNNTTYSCPDFDIDNNTRNGLNDPPDMGADEIDMYLSDGESAQAKDLQLMIYPNPFINSITICYALEKSGPVLLRVFDNYGRLVAEPVNTIQQNGEQKVEWKAEGLPTGVYYCRLQTGNKVVTNKIVKMH